MTQNENSGAESKPRRKSARTKWLEKKAAKQGMTLAELRRDQRSTAMSHRHSQAGHTFEH